MTEEYKGKGTLMAGLGRPDEPVEVNQTRGVVAALIDSLEHYAAEARSDHAKRYLAEAQRFMELGCMMAVKGLYIANMTNNPEQEQ